MVILNITIKVDWSIAKNWLLWQKDIHLLEILGTGCYSHHQLVKLINIDEADGPTYALQLYANGMEKIEYYQQQYDQQFQQVIIEKWGDKYLEFRTLMEVV